MTVSPSNLALARNVPPDGNWYDPERVQVTIAGRPTERQAIQRMVYGDPIGAPYSALYCNGQMVDLDRMLMCSRCHHWKHDHDFDKDARLLSTRRGRRYYCKSCRSSSALFEQMVMDETTRARLTKGSKRRKKK